MDLIKQTANELAKEQKKLKGLEAKYNVQKKIVSEKSAQMLELMTAAGTTSYKNNLATLSVSFSTVPNVEDWDKFYKFIYENKAMDLVQRRISTTAWRDRIEGGEKIGGVTSFNKQSLRITLAK